MTKSATSVNFYRNGISLGGGTEESYTSAVPSTWYIGGDTDGEVFNGRIDEVGYWRKALTVDEITALYNGGAGLAYPFDSSAGPTSVPYVTTTAVSNIFTTSASTGGNVTHDGSTAVLAKGVVWDINTGPTLADPSTNNGTGEGAFTSAITGLNPSTHYYVRAWAINAVGVGYGNEVTFNSSTLIGPTSVPYVTTSSITGITSSNASCGGNVTHDGSTSVSEKGVCWGITIDPSLANSHSSDGTGEGAFTSTITGLNASTHYYVRAYATNAVGTGYGSNVQFDSSIAPPVGPIHYLVSQTNKFYTWNGKKLYL
jgi:hypothetical protein